MGEQEVKERLAEQAHDSAQAEEAYEAMQQEKHTAFREWWKSKDVPPCTNPDAAPEDYQEIARAAWEDGFRTQNERLLGILGLALRHGGVTHECSSECYGWRDAALAAVQEAEGR